MAELDAPAGALAAYTHAGALRGGAALRPRRLARRGQQCDEQPLDSPSRALARRLAVARRGRALAGVRRQPKPRARRRQRADAEDARRTARSSIAPGPGHRGRRGQTRSPPTASSSKRADGAAARRGDAPAGRPRDGRGRQPQRQRRSTAADARLQGRRSRRYQDFLKAYPKDPGNDRVLLPAGARARAGRRPRDGAEDARPPGGRTTRAPRYRDEAQFRRGELLFTLRDYAKAEEAFATVLAGERRNPYHDRSLYMHGWSLFKQARLEEALHVVLRACSTSSWPATATRPTRRPAGPVARPTASWSKTPSASPASAWQNLQGAGVDPDLRRSPTRARATSSASTSSSASSTSSRSGSRTPPTPSARSRAASRCTRRRRCCRRA